MIYYLLDASALLLWYDKVHYLNSRLDYMYKQYIKHQAFFYLPNFCIVEVFNMFARLYYRDKTIATRKQYLDLCGLFKGQIRRGKTFYSCSLNRYHIINTDQIYQLEHTTPPLEPSREEREKAEKTRQQIQWSKYFLNSFDILIIAMGIELKKIHGGNNEVYIITNDERLAEVCNAVEVAPKAIYIKKTPINDLPKPK